MQRTIEEGSIAIGGDSLQCLQPQPRNENGIDRERNANREVKESDGFNLILWEAKAAQLNQSIKCEDGCEEKRRPGAPPSVPSFPCTV